MPKPKKTDEKALHNTIAKYAMERAAGVVAKQGELALEPGSYPFALEVSLTGELLVGQPTAPGKTETIAAVSQAEAFAGLVASLPESERARVVGEGIAAWRDGDSEAQKAMLATMQSVLLTACKKRRMTKEYTPSGRKGAVSCKPSVTITGTAGAQAVSVEVAAA
jgi:hypothetical protein